MTNWKRKGLFYYYEFDILDSNYFWRLTKKLNFFTYHIIKWVHGEETLEKMGKSRKWFERVMK